MKINLRIESQPNKTFIQLTEFGDNSGKQPGILHKSEGWGTTDDMEDIIAIDEAISCLRQHRWRLIQAKPKRTLDALAELHSAVASEFATREMFKDCNHGIYNAMKLAESVMKR